MGSPWRAVWITRRHWPTHYGAREAFVVRGDVAAVGAPARELVSLTDVHGLPVPRAWGLSYLGWALIQLGETAEGLARLDDGQKLLNSLGANVHATFALALRAESLMIVERYTDSLEQAEAALKTAESLGELSYASRLHRMHAKLRQLVYGAADPGVEASLHNALAIARQQNAKGWEIGAALDLAQLWAEQGCRAEARALLAPLYAWFSEGFDTPDLKAAKALLDELV